MSGNHKRKIWILFCCHYLTSANKHHELALLLTESYFASVGSAKAGFEQLIAGKDLSGNQPVDDNMIDNISVFLSGFPGADA